MMFNYNGGELILGCWRSRSKRPSSICKIFNGLVGMGEFLGQLQRTLEILLDKKDEYWRIHSRSSWLTNRDHNTAYVHHHASHCKRRNFIAQLQNDQGIKMENYIASFYSSFLASKHDHFNYEDFFDGIPVIRLTVKNIAAG